MGHGEFQRSVHGRPGSSVRSDALGKTEVCRYCGQRPPNTLDHIRAQNQDWVAGGWADDYATRGVLGPGQTVTYPEPFWAGTEMCSFLILRPQVATVADLVCDEGVHVEFLQLVPIFPGELEFKVAHGADALIAELERAGVPFWDPTRAPLALAR